MRKEWINSHLSRAYKKSKRKKNGEIEEFVKVSLLSNEKESKENEQIKKNEKMKRINSIN